jgi:hypothetical protein
MLDPPMAALVKLQAFFLNIYCRLIWTGAESTQVLDGNERRKKERKVGALPFSTSGNIKLD